MFCETAEIPAIPGKIARIAIIAQKATWALIHCLCEICDEKINSLSY